MKKYAVYSDGQHLADLDLDVENDNEAYEQAYAYYAPSLNYESLQMLSVEEVKES